MFESLTQSLNEILFQTWNNRFILLAMIGALWGIFLIALVTGGRPLHLGIIPRTLIGLRGILFAPFLHANFNHLFFNSIPLLVLANFLLIKGLERFLFITGFLIMISGLLTWLIGKKGIHLGASSIITGYWAILALQVWQQINLTNIILGLVSIYYFAAIFLGVFPSRKGVSWEGHLSGLLAGILLFYYGV